MESPATSTARRLQRRLLTCERETRRLKEREKRLARELDYNRAVAEIAAALASPLSFEEISLVVHRKAVSLTRSGFGFVGYLDADHRLVCPTMSQDVWNRCRVADKSLVFPRFGGLWGWVLEKGEPLLTNSPPADPRSGGLPEGHVPIKRFLGVPAVVEGRVCGIIGVANGVADYEERDRHFLMQLANLYGLTIRRKKTEASLAASEKWNRTLFEQVPIGLILVDPEGNILDANAASQRLLGYTREEQLSLSVDDFFVDPMVRQAHQANLEETLHLRGREVRLQRKGGGAFVGRINVDLLQMNGRTVFLSSLEDITEQKAADEKLRVVKSRLEQLLRLSRSVLYRLDVQNGFRCTFISENIRQAFGYDPAEFTGSSGFWLQKIHPEDAPRVRDYMARLADTVPHSLEYRLLHQDGAYRWVRDDFNIVCDSGGQRREIVGNIIDISRSKQMELQLRTAQKMEALGTLAGGIAHDFNNILGAIIGFTEIAKAHEIDKKSPAQETLNQVLKASHRARELIKQILIFSRREREVQEPVAIGAIIKEGVKMLRASLPASIEIRQEIDADAGMVKGDPTQVHQILMNICANASHAMPGGGTLKVKLGRAAMGEKSAGAFGVSPGDYVKLTVEDTGTGMTPEILANIFDPFFTTKRPGEGSGMGLPVVHGIVKRHGGGIFVESAPGRGSAFHLVFPRIEGDAEEEGDGPVDVPPGKGRILFVDDDALICHMGRKMLAGLGYAVTTVSSGREALAAVRKGRYDLVISDIVMPGMGGLELAREIAGARPQLPVVLCTGYWEKGQAGIPPPGVRAVVAKPFTTGEMARVIRSIFSTEE